MATPEFLTQPAVQSYVDQDVEDYSEWSGAVAPGSVSIFGTGPADTQTYLSWFNFSSGALNSDQNIVTLSGNQAAQFQATYLQDPSGNIWYFSGNEVAVEGVGYKIVPGSPWTLAASFGSGFIAPGGNPSAAGSLTWLTVGSANYIVGGGFSATGSNPGDVWVDRADSGYLGFYGHQYNNGGGNTVVCSGPQSSSSATAYWTVQPFSIYGDQMALGKTVITSSAASWVVGDWPTPNPGITSTIIEAYVGSDFDSKPGATIYSLSGPAYDQTDGNVLVQVVISNGNNANYIAKLNTATGAVMWTTPVPNPNGFDVAAVAKSRIATGYYLYWAVGEDDSGTCYLIATSDGSATTQTFTGAIVLEQQVSDDLLGCIIGNSSWDTAGGPLTLLNETADSGGSLGAVYFVTPIAPGGAYSSYFDIQG